MGLYDGCVGDGSLQNFKGASNCSKNVKRPVTLGRVDLHCRMVDWQGRAGCNGRDTRTTSCWSYTAVRTSIEQSNPRTGVWGVACYTPRARKLAELRYGAPWRVVLVLLVDVVKKHGWFANSKRPTINERGCAFAKAKGRCRKGSSRFGETEIR